MESRTIKNSARKMGEEPPDSAKWEDLMYRIRVRQKIEAGLRDSDAGRTLEVSAVRRKFGLTP